MLAKQLPPGVRVLSLKETPDKGMAALDLAPDLRIFRAEFRIMRPYSSPGNGPGRMARPRL
jgi:hypothetical protein